MATSGKGGLQVLSCQVTQFNSATLIVACEARMMAEQMQDMHVRKNNLGQVYADKTWVLEAAVLHFE